MRSMGARRMWVGALVVVAVAVGCGGDSRPKAFPGSAEDKARELIRLEKLNGLRSASVKGTAEAYATVGDGFCAIRSAAEWNDVRDQFTGARLDRSVRESMLIVKVYCPWLLKWAPSGFRVKT